MVRQTTKVILLEILGVTSLMLMTAVGVLAFLLANGPVNLNFIKDDVEAAMEQARNGRGVEVDRLSLQWMPSQRRLVVLAEGVTLLDESRQAAGYAQTAVLTLDAGSALLGRVELLRAQLVKGWMNIRQDAPGVWAIAGNPLPAMGGASWPQTPQDALQRVNEVLQNTLRSVARIDPSLTLERLLFERFELRYQSYNGTELVLLKEANGRLQRDRSGAAFVWQGLSETAFLPERFGLELKLNADYSELEVRLDLGVLPLSGLLELAGLAKAFGGDMQVDTSVVASVSADQGLGAVTLSLKHESGVLSVPQLDEEVRRLEASIAYAPQSDMLRINQLDLLGTRLQARLTGQLNNILGVSEARRLQASFDTLQYDGTPYLNDRITFEDGDLDISIAPDFQSLDLTGLSLQTDTFNLKAFGQITFDAGAAPGELPLRADITADLIGAAKKADILAFWPLSLGTGARNFVQDRIEDITMTQARAELNLKPDSFAEGYLRDADLNVTFAYTDGFVRFLEDLPPVVQAFGTGRLGGNSFSVNAVESVLADWDLQLVEVDFPQFNPRGQDFTVSAIGAGPAKSILQILSESRLQLESRTGLDPERFSGEGRATFQMRRPALSQVPLSEMNIEAKAQIRDGGLLNTLGTLDLRNTKAEIDVTKDRIIITGFGDLGETPVQFTWRDAFQDDEKFARISASSILTPDFLNAFGMTGRAFLTGEVPVEVQAKIAAGGFQEADIALDLKEARIDFSEIGWLKPVGELARASMQYSGQQTSRVSSVKLVSDRARLDGDIRLSQTGQLQSLNLRRLYVEDMMDVTGEIARNAMHNLEARIQGPFLNISSFISQMGLLGSATSSPENIFPISLRAEVDRLRLRRDLELNQAQLDIETSDGGLSLFAANGAISRGGTLDVRLNPERPGGPLKLAFKSSDAGFIAGAFFGLDIISGGTMEIEGVLASATTPARLDLNFYDTQLRNAPFFTQILSLASLRGLTDTLTGEGLLFTRVEVPLSIVAGRYIIDGARASGPALGLTANGWVGANGKGIELDGVLVPSFGVNSMLGGVPIIGDLLVGRDGEGIFSITYSVRGALNKAQVIVNPLSAVTPGILRRIFENPSDTSIPEQLPVDPGRLPPSAKLPDLPDEEFLTPLPDTPSEANPP